MAHQALFVNNGQICSAGSRTFVHEDIYDQFVAKATEMALAKRVTDPMVEGCDNGPIVSFDIYYTQLLICFFNETTVTGRTGGCTACALTSTSSTIH